MIFPFSREEIKKILALTPRSLFGCWICCREKGKHIYAWPIDKENYTIRIACDRCAKKLKNTVYWYN